MQFCASVITRACFDTYFKRVDQDPHDVSVGVIGFTVQVKVVAVERVVGRRYGGAVGRRSNCRIVCVCITLAGVGACGVGR